MSSAKSDIVLAIMAKTPLTGYVKTRLHSMLGPQRATQVAQQLIIGLLTRLKATYSGPCHVWVSPAAEHAFWWHMQREFDIRVFRQCAGHLGQRMYHAIRHGLCSADRVCVIGTDNPEFDATGISLTQSVLSAETPVVLQPAVDGGYVILGVNDCAPRLANALFDGIPWGSSQVLSVTRERLHRIGAGYHLLPYQRDLDDYQDYLYFLRRGNIAAY